MLRVAMRCFFYKTGLYESAHGGSLYRLGWCHGERSMSASIVLQSLTLPDDCFSSIILVSMPINDAFFHIQRSARVIST
jgi:hypothetical protein